MTRLLAAGVVVAGWWFWLPFPAPGADPVVDFVALRSPRLHTAIHVWHYVAPGLAVVGVWSVAGAVGRVWLVRGRPGRRVGRLPAWPTDDEGPAPAVVVGEVHHPVAAREVSDPNWLTIPERGLYTGMLICGAIGSGKTSACMRPFARQLFGWQAGDSLNGAPRASCSKSRATSAIRCAASWRTSGRGDDYIELGFGGRWQWNPLGDDQLDSYSLAYTVASLINQLFGRSKEPFWQQAYVNLVRWIIVLLPDTSPRRWVTLRDVYRCTLEPGRIEQMIGELEALLERPAMVRIRIADLAAKGMEEDASSWEEVGGGTVRTEDTPKLREQLTGLGIEFEVETPGDSPRKQCLDAVRRWYQQDWSKLDPKLQTSIVEGLSVFLSVFDMPDVAAVFCPPPPKDEPAEFSTDADAAAVARQLPPLDDVIEAGKVLCLNMPAGTNSALSRAVGVMLKQAWLQSLLRRPAEMARRPKREWRPAVFLCDEYQTFATVGEEDPAGDEKAFALTRQARLIPIVATQSISSLRAVLGQSEAWRALLQTLRTRVFLSLADDSSAEIASSLCGEVTRMKASYTVSEQTQRASASLLSGSAGGGTGSVGASKAFSESREPLFDPRDFTLLGNCQAIVIPYDGSRALDARRVYLKPDFLPRDRPYWRAREAGEI